MGVHLGKHQGKYSATCGPRTSPAAAASHGNLSEMNIVRATQIYGVNLQGWSQEMCILASPLGDSEADSSAGELRQGKAPWKELSLNPWLP